MSAADPADRFDLRLAHDDRPDDRSASDNVAALRPDAKLEGMMALIDELQISLEKSNRRIERLLGERSQLTNLLDKRDEQVQRLNRELGRHGMVSSETSAQPEDADENRGIMAWRAHLISFWQAISPSRKGGMPDAVHPFKRGIDRDPETHDLDSSDRRPPIIAHFRDESPLPVLAVLMFGLAKTEIEQLMPVINRDCSAKRMMPLVLTDNDAFETLREHGTIFEYLPPAQDRERFDAGLCWDLYLQRRLALIRQKWQPARVVAFGEVANTMLKLWHDSPFEEAPLPAIVSP